MASLGCAADRVKDLAPAQVKTALDGDSRNEYLLLDVRQPEEYSRGHIPGAVLVPLGELEARQGELDRSKKIITYCRSGRRSLAAAVMLCNLGFTGVLHLDGGILAWPYEKVSGVPEASAGLLTTASSHKDVMMLSVKLEKGSIDFYTQAADRLGKGGELFRLLASIEERHMRRVYEWAVQSLGRGALPAWNELRRDLKVERMEGGIEVDPALMRLEERLRDEMDVLEAAVEKEYLSYDFYQRASAAVSDYDTRVFLHQLAMEERGHANTLLNRVVELVRR